jgi:ElaA protein
MIKFKKVISKSFKELTTTELYAILALRLQVFCVEQNCPYQDIDDLDQKATHVYLKKADKVIAYARILVDANGIYHIGRIVVAEVFRKDGLATIIINHCIKEIKVNQGMKVFISAQSYLKDFYKKFGFKNTGKYYLEDDIPHEQMQLRL